MKTSIINELISIPSISSNPVWKQNKQAGWYLEKGALLSIYFLPLLIIRMKGKPIINQSNFPKVQKQALFIVRPKPPQTRLFQPSHGNRETKSSLMAETLYKSIQQCLTALEAQINEEQVMDRTVSLRIREHLFALRQKYAVEEEGNVETRKDQESPYPMVRKQSSKYFTKQKIDTLQDLRNKENVSTLECCSQQFPRNKVAVLKSNRDADEQETRVLEEKIKFLSKKLQEYESQSVSFGVKIRKIEEELEKEVKEKKELKEEYEERLQKSRGAQERLRASLWPLEDRLEECDKHLKATANCLAERESEIVTLWQLFSK